MKKITNDELKAIELDILKFVDQFCREKDLQYVMNYGTLLGAVRHQGFIPWDDDIDLSMPREDYERFMKEFPKNNRYRILSLETDDLYYNNFIKIIDTTTVIHDNRNDKTYQSGIFIDIFPMDRFDDLTVVKKTYNLESFKLLSFSKHKNIVYKDCIFKDLIRTGFWVILKPISPRYFARKIDKVIKQYTKADGQYIGLLGSKFKEKEVFPSAKFDEVIELPFEDLLLKAPKDYDEILEQYYPNYMELPPVEKQVNPHELDAYYK